MTWAREMLAYMTPSQVYVALWLTLGAVVTWGVLETRWHRQEIRALREEVGLMRQALVKLVER